MTEETTTTTQTKGRSNKLKTAIDVQLVGTNENRVSSVGSKLTLNTGSFYVKYRKKLREPENKDLPQLHIKDFKVFLKYYFERIAERVVYEGFIFILPFHLGRIYFRKSDRKGFLHGKYHPNLHTFRKYYHLRYDKETALFKNRTIWKFKLSGYAKKCVLDKIHEYQSVDTKGIIAHGHKGENKFS